MKDDDPVSNPNPHFSEIIETLLARRSFLGGGLALGAASVGGVGALLSAMPASAHDREHANEPLLGFQGIPVSAVDT